MARRILHVANAYSEYQNMSPAQLIQSVHDNMYKKFVATAQGNDKAGAGSADEAKELENFFQGLKYYSRYQNVDHLAAGVELSVIQQVLANIGPKFRRLTRNLFRYTSALGSEQGARFEDDLALVVEEVLSMGSGKAIESGITKVGTKQVNIGGQASTAVGIDIDGMASDIIASVGTTIYNKMKNIKTKYVGVQGKIDISGLKAQVQITAEPNSYLARIAYLLSKANISAKSYASGYWSGRIRMRISKISQEIHLGSTNLGRVYTDIFNKAAGTPPPVSLSLYMYLKNTKNKEIREAASRLRFIYELTGYGQTYVDGAIQDILDAEGIGHANYFIYNDPASDNIYVQSTAAIIAEMWNEVKNILDKRSVDISKTFFAQSASAFNDLL